MKFQNKLMLTYSMLIVLLVVFLSFVFYRYSTAVFEKNARDIYESLCPKLGYQIDNIILPMDFISTNLISDAGFKSALATLSTFDRNEPKNGFFINEARQTIRIMLSSYSIYKYFYRVIVFNNNGDFFSSEFQNKNTLAMSVIQVPELPWMSSAMEGAGRAVIVSPYEDPWQKENKILVYGRARAVPGLYDNLGFIEVQNRIGDLDSIFVVPGKEFVDIMVLKADGELFYQNPGISGELTKYYYGKMLQKDRTPGFQKNPVTGEDESVITSTSQYSGLTVILVLNKGILLAPLRFIRSITIGISLLIILFSFFYTWFSSRQLAKPLKMIQERMEDTDLSNLPLGKPIDHPDDEIIALDRSFRNLTARLSDSITRELDARTLWMQARLDSLQAQVNPHFLNNILTVIANRGFESGDERIGEICSGVASMLRYSTSTTERHATLDKEIEHVITYLFLMKQRLENRLIYRIETEPEILHAIVPKIVLQQIVENSLNHGYRKTQKPITIGIRGFASHGYWTVEMTDDGEGFEQEKLAELNERMNAIKNNLLSGTKETGLSFGGLGLLNTYSRLLLFYRNDIVWNIGNGPNGGARVILGGPMNFETGETRDAESTDRRG